MKIKIIGLVGLMALATCFFVFATFYKKPETASNIFFENQKTLGRMIKSKGIYNAYFYFQKHFLEYDPSTSHYLGHFLGGEAYKIMTEKGFDVCNYGLDYGCTHGFVIAGINNEGPGFFETVMGQCKKIDKLDIKRDSCIHGVSHTILSLKGYSVSDLKWALANCDQVLAGGYEADFITCYSAIFMENNLMTLDGAINGEWFVTRQFDSEKPTDPCDQIDAKYQWSCYSELSSFWSNNFGDDFERMSLYCKLATSEEALGGCFWGIGRTMSDLYKHDVSRVGRECQRISPEKVLPSCIEGASQVMLNNGVSNAANVCNYLSGEDKKNCSRFFRENVGF